MKKMFGGNGIWSVIKASIIGVPMPLCSCSVIPTAVTLKQNGANNGSTSAFLISTPESGVDSILVTYALIDLPMAIIRPVSAFVSAFFAGGLHLIFNKEDYKTQEVKVSCCAKKSAAKAAAASNLEKAKGAMDYSFGKLVDSMSLWMIVGFIVGALIDTIVPAGFFSNLSMISSRLIILPIGILMYICASASTPIALSLMLKGLSPGSALIFLLVGPATNLTNILVMQKYIGKKGVLINVFSIVFVALTFAWITDYLYANYFTLNLSELTAHAHHEMSYYPMRVVCSLGVIALLIKGVWKEEIRPLIQGKAQHA
jgi:uncharacterized protein